MKTSIKELRLQKIFQISEILKQSSHHISSENACQEFIESFFKIFYNEENESEFALCRIFKSCSFDQLPLDIKDYICEKEENPTTATAKYLTLLATVGVEKEWCQRTKSRQHKAIPLDNPEIIKQAPMMAALFKQIGFEFLLEQQLDEGIIAQKQDQDFGLFLVENAVESFVIPQQKNFVIPYKIKSVFGFGGMFSTGSIYSVIIFSKRPISQDQVNMFYHLAPALKYIQVENELKGRIFNLDGKDSHKTDINADLDRKIEEEKNQVMAEELARANRALTLLTEKLFKTKNEAEKANLAKSEFLSRMSHELRTPLNGIIGFTQVMMRSKKQKLTPNQREDMNHIFRAGKHLLQLINEVLELSTML